MKNIKIFVFVFSICAFFAFPQIASAQWPSDLESGSGSRQQVTQPQRTVTQPRSNSPKKALQSGMIPVSKFGMNFQFPASWMTTDEGVQEPILFVGFLPLADNMFRDNMVICGESLAQQMDVQEYFDLNLQQINSNLKILNKGKLTIGGYEGRVVKYISNTQGMSLQQEQIFIVVGNRGYVITISSLPDRFEKSRKDAYRVVNTITF